MQLSIKKPEIVRTSKGLTLYTCVTLWPTEPLSHGHWELEINHILISISLLKMSNTFHPQFRICILHYLALRYAYDVNGIFCLKILLTLL